ncbi:MAG: phosphatidate cytidylyltransferase [Oscillibacter sp.]|nr:phosphatidate cytidylyltransferase [Oscillibacter sp.]
MKSRILVAVVGVPILLYIVLLGPTLLLMFALALLAGVGGWELYHCVGGKGDDVLPVVSVLIPAGTVVWYYAGPEYMDVWFVMLVLVIFYYAIRKGGEVRFAQTAAVLFGGIAIGYAFFSFLRIYSFGVSRGYLLLPFILSFACDTFAYFVGLTLGKHKLAPKVSPKKTVEGAIGGLAGNVVCGLLFAFVMNRWFGGSISYWPMTILSLFCGAVAQIGDLSFSLIKREFGIKDYGKIFLAHGGVLDRFDSVLFVAPTLAALMQILRIQ